MSDDLDIDLNFEGIRVSTLRGERPIPFNAYIQIGGRQILYCRKGDTFEGERLNRLKSKKLDRLFILEKDREKYNKYLQDNVDEAFDVHSKKDLLSRTLIVQGHQQAVAEELMENPSVEEHYTMAKASCIRFVEFINKNDLALKCLFSLKNEDFGISQHGVNVAALSLAILRNFERPEVNITKLELLALGALIHDIGRQKINLPMETKRSEMSKDQLKIYKSHPQAGIEVLRELSHFDEVVLNIVSEHEEFIDGTGFPQNLVEREINPYSLIVSVANTYDRLVSLEGKSQAEALKFMIIDSMGLHPLDMMKALQTALKKGSLIK
ncbi:MAG: HD domain-containing protein [Bdellovibrionaceae bacterium]|nr:HD domain-containing protein [Pseudobdellovibrionaceae bacterium]